MKPDHIVELLAVAEAGQRAAAMAGRGLRSGLESKPQLGVWLVLPKLKVLSPTSFGDLPTSYKRPPLNSTLLHAAICHPGSHNEPPQARECQH